ncbi:PAQR family membrane homeostasis protein TrhA [Zunongwangia sp.]|uniref:PAQR family membrane homeostasis protein TrhA n=1 Tax=Zunongwangia sp. TaxID=1965325 RepID=UPI003AA9AFD8
MAANNRVYYYPHYEERLNVISHAFGFVLSILGFVLLLKKALKTGDSIVCFSFLVFGLSMLLLYLASTLYHSAKSEIKRYRLNILDHASIYVLIAGTYTPFSLLSLHGTIGWIIFISIWLLAILGIILKIFYTGKYQTLSTIMYVAMGWIIILAIKPLLENLSSEGLIWLLAGGISYTVGALLFSLNKLKYNHAIFHVFVLIGTFCHFCAVYFEIKI